VLGRHAPQVAGRPGSTTATGALLVLLGLLRVIVAAAGLAFLLPHPWSLAGLGLVYAVAVGSAVVVGILGLFQAVAGVSVLRRNRRAMALYATTMTAILGLASLAANLFGGPADPGALAVGMLFLLGDLMVLGMLAAASRR
jgi:hypothetical protein